MARPNERSKKSGGISGPTVMNIRTAGASIYPGQSMPRIRCARKPPDSLHSNVSWDTSRHCFPGPRSDRRVPAVDHWFRESERVWDSAHIHLQRAVRRHKANADTHRSANPIYQPGDRVWLSTWDIRLRLPCKKLSPRYIGPFLVARRINDVTYQLHLPDQYRISPTFHVSLLKAFTNPLLPPSTEHEIPPPPPEVASNETTYTVKEILDSRRRGGRLQYLIDWEGYGPEERSWADKDDILDPSLINDFHQAHPDRPAPRGRGRPRRRSRASGDARGGRGVMSRNHLPHQLNQPPTPAHNHQSTNHEHLQSLTTTIQKLTHLSHSSAGLKVASYSMLVDAYLSARPSWNSSLPVETQVYIQLELFILLPVPP